MSHIQAALESIESWWSTQPRVARNSGLPAQGSLTGALVMLENLQESYVLDIRQHLTPGQAQIRGAGKARTRMILARFGKEGMLEEGGRTNRGLVGRMSGLLDLLKPLQLDSLDQAERNDVLRALQQFLIQQLEEYTKRKRVAFVYHAGETAWQSVHALLAEARKVGKDGAVAQYLVGAKLALRFPNMNIRNDRFSSQDFDIPGDFVINDTAFHITISPNQGHYEKCRRNAATGGYRPYLLVPDAILFLAKQTAENTLPGRITVQSIEAFVAQNMDELSDFSGGELMGGFRRLLDKYNERVDDIEADKSLLVDVPHNLQVE